MTDSDRLRVHHHMDFTSRHLEQPFGLNDLEAFVHHGSRIDGNFGTHVPIGMLERLRLGGGGNLLPRPGAERAAGSGEMNQAHGISLRTQQALEDGRMLRIYRIYAGAATVPHHQRAGGHQGFLVGQGQGFPGTDSRERRFKPAEAHHGSHHHIHFRRLHQFTGGVYAQMHLHARQRGFHLRKFVRIANDHMRHMELQRLLHQQLCIVIGR